MKKSEKNMKAGNGVKKSSERAGDKVRATISIADDCHPDHSEAVKARMKERRAANFSNFCEILIAADVRSAQLQEAAA